MLHSRKVLSETALLRWRDQARRAGRTVVHCHGCFDIVHPGHIHHLQFARSLGDLLVVSVSADPHVNKGVDRPLIPEDLRAESLAALECVDAVYVNPDPTALQLLGTLKPDVYVKGREYEQSRDVRFLAERDAVEAQGGRVVFSSGDVVYSSTALINTLAGSERIEDERVARLRERCGLDSAHLQNLVLRMRGMRVVVVGDYILDRYHFCDATDVAGEGPMLSLRSLQSRDYDGGAGVIALHLAGLGCRPTLVTLTADDEASSHVAVRLRGSGIDLCAHKSRREPVVKHRYLVNETKLLKVDEGSAVPSDSHRDRRVAADVIAACEGADAVVFADFGYGTITPALLERVLPVVRQKVSIIAGDVSGVRSNLLNFRGVDLLCPTEREVREAQHDFSGGLGAVAWNLLSATGARNAIITLGKQGLVTFDGTKSPLPERLPSEYLPALARRAIDPLGCGDALLAISTAALACGASLPAAAYLGATAAAIEATELGNQPVTTDRIVRQLLAQDVTPAAIRLAS